MNNNFCDFLNRIGLDKNQTRFEMDNFKGTSNYPIGLNHSGVTWAVAMRLPAKETEYSKFEREKLRAVETAEFLVKHFGKGIALSEKVTFRFEGNSALVSSDSVKEFFCFQNTLPPLCEMESITEENNKKIIKSLSFPEEIDKKKKLTDERREEIKKYLSEYRGDFFVSRGAPASETLDNYWWEEMIFDVAHTLSVLHSISGCKSLIPIDNVLILIKKFDNRLTEIVSATDFSEDKKFQDYQNLWNSTNDSNIRELIKKELILRRESGKELLSKFISEFEKTLKGDKSHYSCFTHNDPHCDNFIIVKYLYNIKQHKHQYIDREFVNSILEKVGNVNSDTMFSVVYNKDDNSLLYRKFEDSDLGASNVNIICPGTRYDIHLIDIDDATGINQNEQKMYIYDLLIYALSVQNLSSIKGGEMQAADIIRAYYNFVEK